MKHRFTQASIDFIVKASRQKKVEWLNRNRDEYEAVLVEPMRELVQQVSKSLSDVSPGYLFPTRQFARLKRGKDQSKGPFRDWAGILVNRKPISRYEDFPNLYFHVSEKDLFSAAGLYMPSANQTKHIRKWIDQDPSALEQLFLDSDFTDIYPELGTERVLKTKPRDYPIDHPRIEWLKLSAWYVWKPISKKTFFSKDFPKFYQSTGVKPSS